MAPIRIISKRVVSVAIQHVMKSSSAVPQSTGRLAPTLRDSTPRVAVACPIRWLSDTPRDTPEEAEKPESEESAETTAEETAEDTPPMSREENLEAKVEELMDELRRSVADQDNTRRIAQKDVDSARQFAIKSFAKSLLEVSDNLERALAAVPADSINKEENPVFGNLYEGIQMTERGLMKAFESNGLVKYGAIGEAFDPNKHSALFEYTDPDAEPGTIGQVVKAGFDLNNRVLRSAEVGVIKKQD